MKYRISKYNPNCRDENDEYLNDEWTDYSDIGRSFKNKIFSFSDYQVVETNILFVLYLISLEKDILSFEITALENSEKTRFKSKKRLKDARLTGPMYSRMMQQSRIGDIISPIEMLVLCQLTLRNCLWCSFQGGKSFNRMQVDFGWDYYVYVSCSEISEGTFRIAQKIGIYIEEIN